MTKTKNKHQKNNIPHYSETTEKSKRKAYERETENVYLCIRDREKERKKWVSEWIEKKAK